jgi:hypothetical protein
MGDAFPKEEIKSAYKNVVVNPMERDGF